MYMLWTGCFKNISLGMYRVFKNKYHLIFIGCWTQLSFYMYGVFRNIYCCALKIAYQASRYLGTKCPRFALFIFVSHLHTMLRLLNLWCLTPLFSLSLLTTLERLHHSAFIPYLVLFPFVFLSFLVFLLGHFCFFRLEAGSKLVGIS